MAAIAAILDFGPCPKFNGMILGPYLTPPPSFVEIRQGVFPEYCSQTKKQTKQLTDRNNLAKILARLTNQRSFGNKRILAKKNTKNYHGRNLEMFFYYFCPMLKIGLFGNFGNFM